MSLLSKLVEELQKYSDAEISYKTGISISTISNIKSGRNSNPTIGVIEKLYVFLNSHIKEEQ